MSLTFTDFLNIFIEKCKSGITVHIKSTMLYRKWSLKPVIPSERREHPPGFTSGSSDSSSELENNSLIQGIQDS
jgi:hypothetical protein